MQHETSYPSRSASTSSTCPTPTANTSSSRPPGGSPTRRAQPFLLTAGFFETHRPYPRDRYQPADADERRRCPTTCPTPPTSARTWPTSTDRSPSPTPRSAQLLDTLADTGLDRTTWVVFVTDHGPALPRAKSTLYDAGTGIAMIVRPPRRTDRHAAGLRRAVQRRRPGADPAGTAGRRHPAGHRRASRTPQSASASAGPGSGSRPRSTPRRPTTTRSTRSAPSAPRTTATSRTTRARPLLDLPWDIADSAPGQAVEPLMQRAASRARTLRPDRRSRPSRTTCWDLTRRTRPRRSPTTSPLLLNDWRQKTNDVIPSEFAGTRIADRYTETYATHPRISRSPAARRSPLIAASKTSAHPGNSFAHRDRKTRQCLPRRLRLSSRACQPARRRIWCSPRSAVAARCWSNRCGPPAWPANRRSSSSTCRPPASPRSRGSGSRASTTTRSCACSIRSTRASPTSPPPRSGATTSAPSAARPTGCGAAS